MSNMAGRHGPWPLLAGALLLLAGMWTQEGLAVSGQCTSPFVATLPISADNDLYQPGETRSATFSTTDTATCDCTGISVGLLVTVYYQGTTGLPTVADPPVPSSSSTPISASRWSSTRQGAYQTVPFNATTSGLLSACVGGLLNVSLLGINVNGGRVTLKLLKGSRAPRPSAAPSPTSSCAVPAHPDTSPVNAFQHLAMNISVTSTPTCQFPAGTSIPIDLGAVAECLRRGDPQGYSPAASM